MSRPTTLAPVAGIQKEPTDTDGTYTVGMTTCMKISTVICSLTKSPFEVRSIIMSLLGKKDLLNVAKTCTCLWQMAYPLYYESISIKIDSSRSPSAWKNLARSYHNGLRHVRHIRISAGSKAAPVLNRMEAAAMSLLIDCLPRDRILSFKCELGTRNAISVGNLIVLLSTQRHLQRLELPYIQPSSSLRLESYLERRSQLSELRQLALTVRPEESNQFEYETITRLCPGLSEIHIQYPGDDALPGPRWLRESLVHAMRPKHVLHCILRLTLKGHRFDYGSSGLDTTTFPLVRVLELLGCSDTDRILIVLGASTLPNLVAFAIQTTETLNPAIVSSFLGRYTGMREVFVDAVDCRIFDANVYLRHADTLRLLHIGEPNRVRKFCWGTSKCASLLSICHQLRYVHIPFDQFLALGEGPYDLTLVSGSEDAIYKALFRHNHLETVSFGVQLNIPRHLPDWTDPGLVNYNLFEELIGNIIVDRLELSKSQVPATRLKYMSVAIQVQCFTEELYLQVVLPTGMDPDQKHILALGSHIASLPASSMREEILARYANDGYYLLELFVDQMFEGSCKIMM